MPGRDGTGPFGAGMLTGRGMGPCAGYRRAGYGFGPGFGRRRGFWAMSGPAAYPVEYPKETLQEERDFLKSRLEEIDKQLEEL